MLSPFTAGQGPYIQVRCLPLPVGGQDQVYLGDLCSDGAAAPQGGEEGGSSAPPEVCGYGVPLNGPLELPRESTMERLTCGEVLGASDLIVQKVQDLKVRRRCPFSPLGLNSDLGTDALSLN